MSNDKSIRVDSEADDSSDKLASILALDYVDKNGNRYSVPEYAAQHGLSAYDAACRLVRVALGREGALARDRAKRPPRTPKPAPKPVLAPWDLPGDESSGT